MWGAVCSINRYCQRYECGSVFNYWLFDGIVEAPKKVLFGVCTYAVVSVGVCNLHGYRDDDE